MIRLISIVFLLFLSYSSFSQNVFNLDNSRKFASYLYDSGQYDLASDEYERVVFMEPGDSISILRLLSSYRLQKNYDIGLSRGLQLFPQTNNLRIGFFRELFSLSLLSGDFNTGTSMLEGNNILEEKIKDSYALSLLILRKDWETAELFFDKNSKNKLQHFQQLGKFVKDRNNLTARSPYLAAGMSMLVPGSGKFYTGDWQDGLVALLFVASNAWQSYRGFKEDGIKSVYGWIFGGVGAGFWLGNIYGSFKSARNYNQNQQENYYDAASSYIYNNL